MPLLTNPITVGTLTLRNRLVLPSVTTSTPDENGKVTPATLDFFRERSKGFGLVVLEHAYVCPSGKAGPHMLSISDDEDLPGLRELVALLHENGCRTMIQLDHGGGWTIPDLQNCLNPEKNPSGKLITDELTDDELDQIVSSFASAADRARRAGFDGIQIKACHVYLLAQFYSPLTNRRTTGKYSGQTFEGRVRLTLNVLNAVRAAVGPDFPVSVRFSIQDYDEKGSSLEEGVRAAKLLEENGTSLLDLSGGPKYRFFHPSSKEPGWFADDAAKIRSHLHIPVLVAGGVTQIDQAEKLLLEEKTDLVGVCRAVLKDPNWAHSLYHSLR